MRDGAGGAPPSIGARRGLEATLARWTRFVPAIVWVLWALHTIMLQKQLAFRTGPPVDSLPGFFAELRLFADPCAAFGRVSRSDRPTRERSQSRRARVEAMG